MNDYQVTLFENLMQLVDDNEAFFYVDQEVYGTWYRIFNYRLASYTDFCNPDAEEARGITFQITQEGSDAEMLRLASHPMRKFYNLYENPFTMDVDFSQVVSIEDKADGSMISSYIHPIDDMESQLRLKTKGSLHSDQANAAMAWIQTQPEFCLQVYKLSVLGYTVIMEWCAPDNRIVLSYEEPHLRVLGVRNNLDGSYVERDHLIRMGAQELYDRWTRVIEYDDAEQYINSIDDAQGVEGVVFRLANGQRIKKKGKWYMALHHTKDNINSPRRLFETVLEEATDDMKSLFHDDPLAIQTILDMEAFVEEKYNHLADVTLRFYQTNKELDRKDYAILGQQTLDRLQFGAAMSLYLGRDPDFKGLLKKNWKNFGLIDENKSNQDF